MCAHVRVGVCVYTTPTPRFPELGQATLTLQKHSHLAHVQPPSLMHQLRAKTLHQRVAAGAASGQ